jgi:hypothetical protein
MPIDASIPLRVNQPALMTPADVVSLRALSTQSKRGELAYQQERRGMEEQQAARQILSEPDAVDESGLPSLASIRKLYTVAPEIGQKLALTRESHAAREESINLQRAQALAALDTNEARRSDRLTAAALSQYRSYDNAYEMKKAAGASEEEAMRAASEARKAQVDADFAAGRMPGITRAQIDEQLGLPIDHMIVRGRLRALDPAGYRAEKQVIVQEKQAETSEKRADTDAQRAADQSRRDAQRLQIEQQKLQLDKDKVEKGPPQKALPISASQKLMENQQNLNKARSALDLIQSKTGKGATGVKGILPDFVLQRTDPEGVMTRAAIADLGSMVIHDRSGAAVTASEFPRLKPFIPTFTDDQPTVVKKLKRFLQVYQEIVDDAAEFYKESGYKVPELKSSKQPAKSAPSAPSATKQPPAGPFSDPAKERRYQEWKRRQ